MATETDFDEIVKYTQNGTAKTDEQGAESVRILSREYAEDWAIFPHAAQRAVAFCREFEPQADPRELARQLPMAFVQDDPHMILIGFFRGNELIGHMLCDRAVLYYKWVVTVHQYHLDRAISHETREAVIALVKEWAKEAGINGEREPSEFIQWFVRDKKLARMYTRYFKGKPHVLVMRTPVEE